VCDILLVVLTEFNYLALAYLKGASAKAAKIKFPAFAFESEADELLSLNPFDT
jgi:hypothetical protein